MTKISGQFQISKQYQDNFEISGISGQLGPLHCTLHCTMLHCTGVLTVVERKN